MKTMTLANSHQGAAIKPKVHGADHMLFFKSAKKPDNHLPSPHLPVPLDSGGSKMHCLRTKLCALSGEPTAGATHV